MTRRQHHPVRGAYALADTSEPCPNCGAEPYIWCRHPNGEHRSMPCIARITNNVIDATTTDPEGEQP